MGNFLNLITFICLVWLKISEFFYVINDSSNFFKWSQILHYFFLVERSSNFFMLRKSLQIYLFLVENPVKFLNCSTFLLILLCWLKRLLIFFVVDNSSNLLILVLKSSNCLKCSQILQIFILVEKSSANSTNLLILIEICLIFLKWLMSPLILLNYHKFFSFIHSFFFVG